MALCNTIFSNASQTPYDSYLVHKATGRMKSFALSVFDFGLTFQMCRFFFRNWIFQFFYAWHTQCSGFSCIVLCTNGMFDLEDRKSVCCWIQLEKNIFSRLCYRAACYYTFIVFLVLLRAVNCFIEIQRSLFVNLANRHVVNIQ